MLIHLRQIRISNLIFFLILPLQFIQSKVLNLFKKLVNIFIQKFIQKNYFTYPIKLYH